MVRIGGSVFFAVSLDRTHNLEAMSWALYLRENVETPEIDLKRRVKSL